MSLVVAGLWVYTMTPDWGPQQRGGNDWAGSAGPADAQKAAGQLALPRALLVVSLAQQQTCVLS